jgi:hypothetical protein
VCFVVHKNTSELERMILTTMFLLVKKTLTVGAPGRGFIACFSSRHFDGSLVYVNPPVTSAHLA